MLNGLSIDQLSELLKVYGRRRAVDSVCVLCRNFVPTDFGRRGERGEPEQHIIQGGECHLNPPAADCSQLPYVRILDWCSKWEAHPAILDIKKLLGMYQLQDDAQGNLIEMRKLADRDNPE